MKSKISLFILSVFAMTLLFVLQGCSDTSAPSGTIENVPVTGEAQPAVSETPSAETAITETPSTEAATSSAPSFANLMNNSGYLTFLDLKPGQPKDEVDEILGEGKQMDPDTFDGDSVEKYEYVKDGVTIWVTFSDGYLSSKSSQENTDWSTPITAEQFARLKNDMTLNDVTALLGKGQLTNESYSDSGEVSKTYFWNIETGYKSVTVMFKDDKVSYISDMNMD